MSALRLPAATCLLVLVVASSGLAGCFGGSDGGDSVTDDPARLAVSLVGMGVPDGEEGLLVQVTIDHLALLTAEGTWHDVLTAPATADVPFEPGLGEPAFLVDVPLPPGRYEAIEIIATAAEVTDDAGTSTARMAAVACYSDVAVTAEEGTVPELQLLVSGPDALQRDGTSWTFQPAVIGSLAPEDAAGEGAVGEPDCRTI